MKKGSCYLQEEGFCLEARLHLHRLMQQPLKGRFYALLYNDRLNVFSNCFRVNRKELYNPVKSHNGLGSVKEVIRIGKMCPPIFLPSSQREEHVLPAVNCSLVEYMALFSELLCCDIKHVF